MTARHAKLTMSDDVAKRILRPEASRSGSVKVFGRHRARSEPVLLPPCQEPNRAFAERSLAVRLIMVNCRIAGLWSV